MGLKTKKNTASVVGAGLLLAVCLDASAVPFFSKQNRNTLAQSQADAGNNPQSALVTGYSQDVQGGVADFQFLARNFSGSGTGRPISVSGALGPVVPPLPTTPNQTPIPGSLALVGLGVSLMLWRRKK